MSATQPESSAESLDRVIRERRTVKVLADAPLDVATDRAAIEALVAGAGWAPFHLVAAKEYRETGELRSVVPWRCYLLDVAACRALRDWLLARGDASTFPRLLAASAALVLVTWLPDPPALPRDTFAGTRENMEHVAAAGAAAQNLLLGATARGLRTFWATGGPLRTPATFAHLGIPDREILLGALFLFPADTGDAETKAGGLRDKRGEPAEWSRWVTPGDAHDGSAPG